MTMNRNYNIDKKIDVFLEEGMGDIFQAASEDGLDLCSFADVFLRSKTFTEYFVDATIFSQAPRYVLEVFDEESHTQIKDAVYDERAEAFWLGYLFASWHIDMNMDGAEIANNYDLGRIINAYDVLHTQSVEYAIDFICSEYGISQQDEIAR